MPRGLVKLENTTEAERPGATITGDLNWIPEGWNVPALVRFIKERKKMMRFMADVCEKRGPS